MKPVCIACGKPADHEVSISADVNACSDVCLFAYRRRRDEANKPKLRPNQKIAHLDPSFWDGFNAWI